MQGSEENTCKKWKRIVKSDEIRKSLTLTIMSSSSSCWCCSSDCVSGGVLTQKISMVSNDCKPITNK